MFLAMNRFQIAKGFEAGFEKIWRERESYLNEVPGFVSFALLKETHLTPGSADEDGQDYVLYASHSVWQTRAAFDDWTESESFRKAHAQTSAPKGTYLGHPNLELFDSVIE